MATLKLPSQISGLSGIRLNARTIAGFIAILAPASYIIGRGAADYLVFSGIGMMIGISVGLFFGSLYDQFGKTSGAVTIDRKDVLGKIRDELAQDQALFEARKGSTNLYARIAYPINYWEAATAAGDTQVIHNSNLLKAISAAYYWLNQASRLEVLAYEAKYAQEAAGDSLIRATHLISEVRLLDGQLETNISAALSAIDAALKQN